MCAAPSSALPQAPLQTLAGETSAAGLGPQLSSSIAPLPYFGFRFVACFRALAPSALSAREHQRFLVASAMAREIKRRIISDRVGMSCSRRRSSSRSALICAERRICRILSCSMSGIGAAAARLVNIVVAPVTIDVVCIVITVLTYCQASCLLIPHETSGRTRREYNGARYMDAERKRMRDEIGALKKEFSGPVHPGITRAMDVAASALREAVREPEITPMDVTKRMFKAILNDGFMIMHRDEMQNALLAAGRAGKILNLKE